MSSPKMRTRPDVGTSSPASRPSNVDLPDPEAPTIATVSPAPMVRLISSRIVRLPVASCTTLAEALGLHRDVCHLLLCLAQNLPRHPFARCSRHSRWRLHFVRPSRRRPDAPGRTAARPVILVVGDSLSAEYGLPRGSGWVQLLAERCASSGSDYTVVNASISGETTSGGRTRLPALLKQHRPAVVILELGANDGLRGLPLTTMRTT